jgi:hypothetical protein
LYEWIVRDPDSTAPFSLSIGEYAGKGARPMILEHLRNNTQLMRLLKGREDGELLLPYMLFQCTQFLQCCINFSTQTIDCVTGKDHEVILLKMDHTSIQGIWF